MNMKQKERIEIWQMNIDSFSNQILLELLDYLLVYSNQDANSKRFKTRRYYLPKSIVKNYNVIINGKNLYHLAIDWDIKRYEEIRKSTTEKGEDYTTNVY